MLRMQGRCAVTFGLKLDPAALVLGFPCSRERRKETLGLGTGLCIEFQGGAIISMAWPLTGPQGQGRLLSYSQPL